MIPPITAVVASDVSRTAGTRSIPLRLDDDLDEDIDEDDEDDDEDDEEDEDVETWQVRAVDRFR